MHDVLKIGIGVTTRNRSECLALALYHHCAFAPSNCLLDGVVVDDSSDDYHSGRNEAAALAAGFAYKRLGSRSGVAAAKNACLESMGVNTCSFLFDDDAFPARSGWHEPFIVAADGTGAEHSLWRAVSGGHAQTSGPFDVFQWPTGVCLFLYGTAQTFFMDESYGTYGYEHVDLSLRIHAAGLQHGYPAFICPSSARESIYSLDHHWLGYGQPPPIGNVPEGFGSSMCAADRDVALDVAYRRFAGMGWKAPLAHVRRV